MAALQAGSILRQLRQAVLRQDGTALTDGQLLRSFLNRRDEVAFEALVRRHGAMVRGVCCRVLRNTHDADDAFQAAFLVLLRKAPVLATREVVGDWLHGVAYRTALKARTAEARRRAKERQVCRSEVVEEENRPGWHALLDQEVGRLPEKYRLPVVLCDLEGRTRKEAAHQLGWPEGTVSGRLARARAMLARRLTRRGMVLSTTVLAAALTREAVAYPPIAQVHSTCKAAMMFAAGEAAGAGSVRVAALTEGVVRAMFMDKLKTIAVLLSSFLVLGIGVGAWRHSASAGQGPKSQAEKPVLPTRDMKAPAVPAIPSGERAFQIDLSIVRWKDEERKVTDASLRALEGKAASFAKGQDFWVDVGGGKVEKVVMGSSVRVVVRRNEDGRVRLDMTVSQTANGTFGEEVMLDTKSVRFLHTLRLGQPITTKFWPDGKDQPPLEVTAAVREAKAGPANGKTIAEAEKSLKLAEFYQRSGHPDSARFYYELICRRYPDTLYAERAKERLAEEKPPARVGQVFIIGNKKIRDDAILEQVQLFPGQILSYPDLAAAEKRLSRLKGLKGSPKVTVIDREGDGAYKDIQITVEEK